MECNFCCYILWWESVCQVSLKQTNKKKKKSEKKRKSKSLGHKGENPPAPTARTSVVLGIIKLITQHTVAAVVS